MEDWARIDGRYIYDRWLRHPIDEGTILMLGEGGHWLQIIWTCLWDYVGAECVQQIMCAWVSLCRTVRASVDKIVIMACRVHIEITCKPPQKTVKTRLSLRECGKRECKNDIRNIAGGWRGNKGEIMQSVGGKKRDRSKRMGEDL